MMCYKSKEDPLYEAARKHPIAAKRFMSWTEEAIRESILKERRIMGKEDDIESLIASTFTHIKTALENKKPREAHVYTQILFLLRQTLEAHGTIRQSLQQTFEEISEKHIRDA